MVTSIMAMTELKPDSVRVDDDSTEIERVALRDETAFNALYLRYHPRLTQFVRPLLHDPTQTEEVVSDTLYAVWTGASRFQSRSKVSTWIFGIAYRTAMKAIRAGSRHSRFSDDSEDSGDLVDIQQGNDPANSIETRDQTEHLLKAMDRLSPEQRAVVELTAIGWSCHEIGDIIDCPPNTVKTRMSSARKKLRSLLQTEASQQTTQVPQ